ncbi:uncharacterized protein ACO6RY_13881 [Pungitius sinensis]
MSLAALLLFVFFPRCPIIATNGDAVGPPLPVYCESAFIWRALFQTRYPSGAPRHAALNEESTSLKMPASQTTHSG